MRDAKTNPWPQWPVWDNKEEKALIEVLNSGVWSYNGPKEIEFNKDFAEFTGVKYAISAANGTVTLQMALEACGIGVGDEVILPGLTWQATAATIIDVNATPILVDVCEDTWCIDPKAIEKAITPRTKAIMPVHLYGSFADMDEILSFLKTTEQLKKEIKSSDNLKNVKFYRAKGCSQCNNEGYKFVNFRKQN